MAAPYIKRFPGGFLDLPNQTTPVDSAFLNAVETALLHLLGEAPANDEVGVWVGGAGGGLVYQKITNAQISAAAAIDKSKLAALNIVDADIAGGAAIAKSKLAALGIVDADVAAGAAIAIAKLQGYPADATKVLKGNGTWGSVTPGVELIQEISGTGASGVITFSAIPATYRALQLRWSARTSAAVASANMTMQFNGTGAASDYLYYAAGGRAYATNAVIGTVPGTSTTPTTINGDGWLEIYRYAEAVGHQWQGQYSGRGGGSGTAANDFVADQCHGTSFLTSAQAAIASIAIMLASGNFTTTTKFALYGIL